MAVNVSNSRNALIASPLDTKLVNYYIDEYSGDYIIETISDYLTRVEFEHRFSGVIVSVLVPKVGITPNMSYVTTEDFSIGLNYFDIKQYAFIGGLLNENFIEVNFNSTEINEVLTGNVNGINTIFKTSKPYKPDSINIYVNGLKEFFFSKTGESEITLDFAPSNEVFIDKIEAIYKPI